ncbi:NAD(P)/FAD-dependent oxidoreductase [Variovorax sp. PAMC28562]|uniref:NAD(P)/FAD-dependent oxidoreductase n=1 Tax=Variovorax sp. PAMC28562 TaxID=2762323 RepID=UPI00164DF6F8|nr:NAD(P)/FAD-dependent oxidoreductase [Variovorax sp. PAMC28562]QNK75204.1 NAD(P)/FAD-dependent oxidoreductase [Variovorax sp. PAMC28562]
MKQYDVVIVGGGFTGLTAAYCLAKAGKSVKVIEADSTPGGLAGTFEFSDGVTLEKFYHHWFNNDVFVPELVKELGMEGDVITLPSRTGMYFNGRMWKLSTPMDLLRFKALPLIDRFRLGFLVLQVRRVKDWRTIEHLTIREWLEPLCGKTVYRIVWEPLIQAKFSVFAETVNAVWFWKKLVLRGSTRDKKGGEELAYFKGGFGRLAESLVSAIRQYGGDVSLGQNVTGLKVEGNRITAVQTGIEEVSGSEFLFTPAFPIIANMFESVAPPSWLANIRRVKYLGNVCLVLRLNRSLSDTYWLNVNDPGFPFVGVIEHTNFDAPENYNGSRIAFLSRYLAVQDPVWAYSDEEYLQFALTHLTRMFPDFNKSWIVDYRVWHAEFAQPVTERGYSSYVPGVETPFENGSISTMAQVYPEDRGTNYAIREGRSAAMRMLELLKGRAT